MIKQTAFILILAVAVLGLTGIATAQDRTGTTSQQQLQKRKLLQKLRKKQRELQQIHAATFNANPDLRKQQHQFIKRMRQAIKDQGYDIEASREHVKSLAGKLGRVDNCRGAAPAATFFPRQGAMSVL